jgi:aryl-alcohol dehydrogenase-like predicted oxidoreductase
LKNIIHSPGLSERRTFGATALQVSPFGLGCARLGGIFHQDGADHLSLLSTALDAGINFFDTADIYSQGESEALLGRAFDGRRHDVIIASKAGYVLPARRHLIARMKPLVRPVLRWAGLRRAHVPGVLRGAPAQDFSPAHLKRALEGSLRRLRTDFLDLFQLHSPPAGVIARGEWLEALEQLKSQGKIRYYGISCDTADAAFAALRFPTVSAIQVSLSLLERGAEAAIAQASRQGTAVIVREVLANGLLVKAPAAVNVEAYCQSAAEAEEKRAQLIALRDEAEREGSSVAELALKFVAGYPGVSVSLVGASRSGQLDSLLRLLN